MKLAVLTIILGDSCKDKQVTLPQSALGFLAEVQGQNVFNLLQAKGITEYSWSIVTTEARMISQVLNPMCKKLFKDQTDLILAYVLGPAERSESDMDEFIKLVCTSRVYSESGIEADPKLGFWFIHREIFEGVPEDQWLDFERMAQVMTDESTLKDSPTIH